MQVTKTYLHDTLTMLAEEYDDKDALTDVARMDARVNLWYAALNGYPYELVDTAVANVMRTLPFRPKLADICNEIKRLQSLLEKSDEELWAELSATFYEVEHNANGYKYDAEFERCVMANERIYEGLSPELKLYVRNVAELIEIARKDAEGRSIERAMFKKRIPELREQERLRRETPKEILELAAASVPRLTEGKDD